MRSELEATASFSPRRSGLSDQFEHAGQDWLGVDAGQELPAAFGPQPLTVYCATQECLQMLMGIKFVRASADALQPEIQWQHNVVAPVDFMPSLEIGCLRVQNRPVKVEYNRLQHRLTPSEFGKDNAR